MSIIVITGMLSNVLSVLTAALAFMQSITGAEAAAIAIKDAIISVTEAIGILNAILPMTIP